MTNLLETSISNIDAFIQTPIGSAEPLQDSLALAAENPKMIVDKFYAYYNVVRDLFNLSPEDLATIHTVNEQLGTTRGADDFLTAVGDQRENILSQMRQIGNLDNPHNQAGINQLTEMMNNAWTIRQKEPDWTPKDGDPKADNVIWGFVKGATNPEIDVDFALCHGIERILTDYMPENEFVHHKDWLLCALNDVIALKGLRGEGYEANVFSAWSRPRPEGLGWISQRRLDAYKEVANHDRQIVTTGEGWRGETGINCVWELHALEIYKESDGKLSQILLDEVAQQLTDEGVAACELTVADGYDNEDANKPHYFLKGTFNTPEGLQLEKTTFSIGYTMTEGEAKIRGSIRISVDLPTNFEDPADLLTGIFQKYDELLLKYYPEMPAVYVDDSLQFE